MGSGGGLGRVATYGESLEDDAAGELAVGQEGVVGFRFEVGLPERLAGSVVETDGAGRALAVGTARAWTGWACVVGCLGK
jgi:hypothetical protein